ncbi:carbohydrate-binding module family 18 protein, partial [Piromyces sp. E2]
FYCFNFSTSTAVPVTFSNDQCGPGYGSCDLGFCCSQYGYCGKTDDDYCDNGCKSEFGDCPGAIKKERPNCGPSIVSTDTVEVPMTIVSDGCQRGYGKCLGGGSSSNTPKQPEYPISKDDRCGPKSKTRLNMVIVIGTTNEYCGTGCQSEFGACNNNNSNNNNTGSNPVVSTNPSTSESNEPIIWNFLYERIGNKYGTADFMGNLYAESQFLPNNLEDTKSKESNLSDEEYTRTRLVNNGTYQKFTKDYYGYGLAQWTHPSRKTPLLAYAQHKGTSIDDLDMQLEFLWDELVNSYGPFLNKLKNATSVREASNATIFDYEIPEDRGIGQQNGKAAHGERIYNKYA